MFSYSCSNIVFCSLRYFVRRFSGYILNNIQNQLRCCPYHHTRIFCYLLHFLTLYLKYRICIKGHMADLLFGSVFFFKYLIIIFYCLIIIKIRLLPSVQNASSYVQLLLIIHESNNVL